MIVIDTNVASEPLKPRPDAGVMAWLANSPPHDLFMTSITVAEMLAGMAIMPDGRRKSGMVEGFEQLLVRLFHGRILEFNESAARNYAQIVAAMRTAGRGITLFDCQIAAIAKCRGMAVATRDATPFREAGIAVINPWTDE